MSNDREAIEALTKASDDGHGHVLVHYLYFPDRDGARSAANELRGLGFGTEERLGADGVNWLVLARHHSVATEDSIAVVRQLMESLVKPRGGEYDGWEAEIDRTRPLV